MAALCPAVVVGVARAGADGDGLSERGLRSGARFALRSSTSRGGWRRMILCWSWSFGRACFRRGSGDRFHIALCSVSSVRPAAIGLARNGRFPANGAAEAAGSERDSGADAWERRGAISSFTLMPIAATMHTASRCAHAQHAALADFTRFQNHRFRAQVVAYLLQALFQRICLIFFDLHDASGPLRARIRDCGNTAPDHRRRRSVLFYYRRSQDRTIQGILRRVRMLLSLRSLRYSPPCTGSDYLCPYSATRWRRESLFALPGRPAPEPSISSGATPALTCLRKRMDTLAEGVVEIPIAAEDRIGIHGFDASRRPGTASPRATYRPARTARAVPATSTRSIGCPRCYVVTAGQMPDHAVCQGEVEGGGRPDIASRRFHGETLHRRNVAAEMADQVNGVRD